MRVSRSALYAFLGTLMLVSISFIPVQAIQQQQSSDITLANHKRDLIGHLIGNQPAPAPAPGGNIAPPSTPSAAPVGPDAAKTGSGPLPSLVGEVLNPLGGGSSSTTAPTKKKATTDATDETGGASTPSEGASSDKKGKADEALSPGLIVLLVIVLMAVVAAVLLSCYKVRQSRRRRHQSWDEDILKNHAGSVGYSEGGGYGMYVGGGKEKPDLWRKNLDLFHRE
ncbi:hypothetical protein KVV02_005584 [Mortierella alpina]|uniref:Mid2 domain-containing protein n=1 Tax=Mortierella alpina TaxID=64518 RepID=A0A9P8A2B9_MORAP|nr:hypothetical protein KVV02_005584 [Mortierella alpina]